MSIKPVIVGNTGVGDSASCNTTLGMVLEFQHDDAYRCNHFRSPISARSLPDSECLLQCCFAEREIILTFWLVSSLKLLRITKQPVFLCSIWKRMSCIVRCSMTQDRFMMGHLYDLCCNCWLYIYSSNTKYSFKEINLCLYFCPEMSSFQNSCMVPGFPA